MAANLITQKYTTQRYVDPHVDENTNQFVCIA
jgi:hypothetical protein